MKLNYDCLRDFLFVIESETKIDNNLFYCHVDFKTICKKMPKYSKKDIAYTSIIAKEANLIIGDTIDGDGFFFSCIVWRLTYSGHEFLETIRDRGIWNSTKAVLKKAGTTTVQMILSTAIDLVKAKIHGRL